MFFLLGFFSLVQMIFLPGFIACKALKLNRSLLSSLVFSFYLSVIINHVLVVSLVLISQFTQTVLIAIFILEVAIFIFQNSKYLFSSISFYSPSQLMSYARNFFRSSRSYKKVLWFSSTLFLGWVFFSYKQFFTQFGIFFGWDGWISWNRWAVDWYFGSFPTLTFRYPQVLPTNWSLTYIFMDTILIQGFAKLFTPIFAIIIMLGLADLGIRYRKPEYFFASGMAGMMQLFFCAYYLYEGYADVALGSMAFGSIYCLFNIEEEHDYKRKFKLLVLGAVLTGFTALTKQPGLFLVLIYPFLAFFIVLKNGKWKGYKKRWLTMATLFAISVLIAAPWYVYKEKQIKIGQDASELKHNMVVVSTKGDTVFEKFKNSVIHLGGDLGINGINLSIRKRRVIIYFIFPLLLLMGSFFRQWNWVFFLFVVPYFLIWGIISGCCSRYLALIMPSIGIIMGLGIYSLFSRSLLFFRSIKKQHSLALSEMSEPVFLQKGEITIPYLNRLLILVLGLIILIMMPFFWTGLKDENLVEKQTGLYLQIGDPGINKFLWDYFKGKKSDGYIFTNYLYMGALPYIGRSKVDFWFNDLEETQKIINEYQRLYLLIKGPVDDRVLTFINDEIKKGSYELIEEKANFKFVKIRLS